MESRSLDSASSWRLDTFIVPPGALEGRAVSLAADEQRHAVAASRARPGDVVRLIDGEGAEALARIESGGEAASLTVLERRTHAREEGVSLTIAQALPKGRGMDEAVRRCAELGVDRIVPIVSERTIVRLHDDSVPARLERWRAVAASAAKQSRGVFVTRVREPVGIADLEPLLREADLSLVAWEEERAVSLCDALNGGPRPARVLAVVGPEGGLSEREIESLESMGARPVALGRRILRSDWAAAALAAMISYELGGLLP